MLVQLVLPRNLGKRETFFSSNLTDYFIQGVRNKNQFQTFKSCIIFKKIYLTHFFSCIYLQSIFGSKEGSRWLQRKTTAYERRKRCMFLYMYSINLPMLSPVLKRHLLLVLSYKISYELNLFEEVTCLIRPFFFVPKVMTS